MLDYISDVGCEMTLMHPSSSKLPQSCETRITKIKKTYWIPLHLSNQWLYVAPKSERLSTIYDDKVKLSDIKERSKLKLQPGCKPYTSSVTLYAITKFTKKCIKWFLSYNPNGFSLLLGI